VIDLDAVDAVIFHTGLYSVIDPPKFKTTGFSSKSTYIPVMPLDIKIETGDSDFLTIFPSSGTIDCNGDKYTYTSKNTFFSTDPPQGPFQYRAVLNWTSFNKDRADNQSYKNYVRAIEFYKFAWLSDADHHDDFLNALIATNENANWLNDQVFYKPWITTNSKVVWQRERGRYYAVDDLIGDPPPGTTRSKVWITHGLAGVAPSTKTKDEKLYQENSFVYLDSDDSVALKGFSAHSGDDDLTIGMLLDIICRIAGTEPNFPGETTQTSHDYANGEAATI
jgi:hypothetical protein